MADTQAIKDRIDIVQLIQEYLPLKKAGANWKANCPFHHEKTPSFMVHPDKQIWHCFGCGKGGDIFSFLEEMEGLDFSEALKILADRAGIKIDNTFQSDVQKSQKTKIFEINDKAATFFHRLLTEMSAAKPAMDYLKQKRGLSDETIRDWRIGYIPEQWDLLTQYMLKNGVGVDDLVLSGLTVKNEERRSHYDRFRGRVMFPIWDALDHVAGFTGRLLVEKEGAGGKYINTPQSPVFDKSRLLYGLNKAKQEIKSKDLAVLVEGQMDVIACHSANMKNVIASSGTALTDEQLKLIKRYTNNIAVAFDADLAGEAAAKRGIDAAIQAGLNVKIIVIPDDCGKDADECLKKNSSSWFKAVESARGVMEWYFDKVFSGLDISNPRNKQYAADTLLYEISKIPHAVERDAWIQKLSEMLSVEPSLLSDSMKSLTVKSKKSFSADKPVDERVEKASISAGKIDMLQNKLWSLIIKEPKIFVALHSYLKEDFFTEEPFKTLYDFAEKQYNNSGSVNFSNTDMKSATGESLTGLLYMQAEKDYAEWNYDARQREAEILINEIEKRWKRSLRDLLKAELTAAQAANDSVKENEILSKIMELTK